MPRMTEPLPEPAASLSGTACGQSFARVCAPQKVKPPCPTAYLGNGVDFAAAIRQFAAAYANRKGARIHMQGQYLQGLYWRSQRV